MSLARFSKTCSFMPLWPPIITCNTLSLTNRSFPNSSVASSVESADKWVSRWSTVDSLRIRFMIIHQASTLKCSITKNCQKIDRTSTSSVNFSCSNPIKQSKITKTKRFLNFEMLIVNPGFRTHPLVLDFLNFTTKLEAAGGDTVSVDVPDTLGQTLLHSDSDRNSHNHNCNNWRI